MTHPEARALTEAGYMPLREYLEMCEREGWATDLRQGAEDAMTKRNRTRTITKRAEI